MLRFLYPCRVLNPRFESSNEYGFMSYKNKTMTHKLPGKWKFIYTTNEYRCRGKFLPISNIYHKNNIIVLGDSYSFGMGVNDGEEYPSILNEIINENFNVINLSCCGWGLTQQIRRFYEFGILYQPKIVILQYCKNDLEDNFRNRVTTVEKDQFVFHPVSNSIIFLNKYLSDSILQESQIYNYLTHYLFPILKKVVIQNSKQKARIDNKQVIEEDFYIQLMTLFAQDLTKKEIKLILMPVNNEINNNSYLLEKIKDLDNKGYLYYLDIDRWFDEPIENYQSPEGHLWGKKAHQIIGKKLAAIISDINSEWSHRGESNS